MKKKFLLILLSVMCIGTFMSKEVFASEFAFYHNVNIDYSFFVKDNFGNNIKNLHFKLYDKTGVLLFESQYDDVDEYYYFKYDEKEYNTNEYYNNNEYNRDYNYYNMRYSLQYWNERESRLRSYIPYYNKYDSYDSINNMIISGSLHGTCGTFWGGDMCTTYTYLPMTIESVSSDFNYKKIVLASVNVNYYDSSYDGLDSITGRVFLANSKRRWKSDYISLKDTLDENIQFMRNAMYDYSDELWEQLNSGPIASSELQYDNSDTELNSPKVITLKTNDAKAIYSKYNSNVNYRFKVKNGNGMNFKLHDISNTFNFSSLYDKDSDTYSIVDNSTDTDYQDGIKEFSKIIINEIKNGNFNDLANKYKSITSESCSSSICHIYTYMPLILEGESGTKYAKQIVLGLLDIQYRQESGNDYYDISLNLYNNTCDLLNSNIDVNQSDLINLSRAIEKDYSSSLMNQYSDGSIALEDIYKDVDVNTLKDEYCNKLPLISLRQNPKTLNNGVLALIISIFIVIGSSMLIIKKRNVKV